MFNNIEQPIKMSKIINSRQSFLFTSSICDLYLVGSVDAADAGGGGGRDEFLVEILTVF